MTSGNLTYTERFVENVRPSYLIRMLYTYFKYLLLRKLRLVRKVDSISVEDAKQLLDLNRLALIDVRAQEHHDVAHIPGSIHIEADRIKQQLDTIPRDKLVAVMCYGGGLSQAITRKLKKKGFSNAINLEGGFEKWAITHDPDLLDAIW